MVKICGPYCLAPGRGRGMVKFHEFDANGKCVYCGCYEADAIRRSGRTPVESKKYSTHSYTKKGRRSSRRSARRKSTRRYRK